MVVGVHQYGTTIDINATPDPRISIFSLGRSRSRFKYFRLYHSYHSTGSCLDRCFRTDCLFDLGQRSNWRRSASALENPPYFFDSNYTLQASPSFSYNFTHWSSSTGSLDLLDSTSDSVTTFSSSRTGFLHR